MPFPQSDLMPEGVSLMDGHFSRGNGPTVLALAIHMAAAAEWDCPKGKVWPKRGAFLHQTFPLLEWSSGCLWKGLAQGHTKSCLVRCFKSLL